MISKEEATQLKEQVLGQINSTFPEDKKQDAISQINSMNDEQFEVFLNQNNLIPDEGQTPQTQQCVFCSIIKGDITSHKIQENSQATAILEINPVSKGHTIIIPKTHSEKAKDSINPFTQEISKRIQEKLKPNSVTIIPSSLFGHEIINIIPVYKNETINSPKYKATPEELTEVFTLLEKKKEPEKIEAQKVEVLNSEKMWFPKRIP